jgi:S-adenosyl methyltransferase
MHTPEWLPAGIDTSEPSIGRVYDAALGGTHNLPVDREFLARLEVLLPAARRMFRANRLFMGRAVRFMAAAGVRQFLDLGSGIPTAGNVHEIAQQAAPESRVVYVDIDPVAVAQSRTILAGNDRAAVIHADVRDTSAILDHPDTRALLDLGRPVGLIMAALLHAIPDEDDPYALAGRLVAALPPGSYVAITHATHDSMPERTREAERITNHTATPGYLRPRADVLRFFTGLEMVDPGLVWTEQWRPDHPDDVGPHPEQLVTYAGVGRKD